MTQTAERLKRLYADQSGATSIEYALIAILISVVIIASASAIGTSLNSVFNNVAGKLDEFERLVSAAGLSRRLRLFASLSLVRAERVRQSHFRRSRPQRLLLAVMWRPG